MKLFLKKLLLLISVIVISNSYLIAFENTTCKLIDSLKLESFSIKLSKVATNDYLILHENRYIYEMKYNDSKFVVDKEKYKNTYKHLSSNNFYLKEAVISDDKILIFEDGRESIIDLKSDKMVTTTFKEQGIVGDQTLVRNDLNNQIVVFLLGENDTLTYFHKIADYKENNTWKKVSLNNLKKISIDWIKFINDSIVVLIQSPIIKDDYNRLTFLNTKSHKIEKTVDLPFYNLTTLYDAFSYDKETNTFIFTGKSFKEIEKPIHFILKTSNFGNTFQTIVDSIPLNIGMDIDNIVHFENTIVFTSLDEIVYSLDDGKNWKRLDCNVPNFYYKNLTALDKDNFMLIAEPVGIVHFKIDRTSSNNELDYIDTKILTISDKQLIAIETPTQITLSDQMGRYIRFDDIESANHYLKNAKGLLLIKAEFSNNRVVTLKHLFE